MKYQHSEHPERFDERLRGWSSAEPGLGEAELRRALLNRLGVRRPRSRVPLALAAAAASLVVLFVGLQTTRRTASTNVAVAPEVVYDTGDNVILVLRDDGPPIYVVKDVLGTGETP